MSAKKSASARSFASDLKRVDAHRVRKAEDQELPELSEEMLARATVNRGGRPAEVNPRQLISLRVPATVLARWRASGRGWQTRMVQRLSQPLR